MPTAKRKTDKYVIDFSNIDDLDGEQFHRLRAEAQRHLYPENQTPTLKDAVFEWMKANGYSKKDIAAAKAATGLASIQSSVGTLALLLERGCPDYLDKHDQWWQSAVGTSGEIKPLTSYLARAVDVAIEDGRARVRTSTKKDEPARVVSIQDRMREQVGPLIEQLEHAVDEFRNKNLKVKDFDPHRTIVAYQPIVKSAQAQIIKSHFARMRLEARQVAQFKTDEIKEGYGHMTARERKDLAKMYEKINDAVELVIQRGKVKRKPRKKTAKKVNTSKVRYLKEHAELGMVSVDPARIDGASEVWVYNVKTRKLGLYVADPYEKTMTIKGSTIQGFDPHKSQCKTVRKPDDLKGFANLTKAKANKLYKSLTTKAQDLTGRLNKDTLILKAKS